MVIVATVLTPATKEKHHASATISATLETPQWAPSVHDQRARWATGKHSRNGEHERSGDFPDRRFSFTPFAFNNFLLKTHREPRRLALDGGTSNRFDAPAGVVYSEAQRRKLYVISNEHYVLTTKENLRPTERAIGNNLPYLTK